MTQQQLADAGSFARLYHTWRKADERFDNTTTSHDQRQALALVSRLEVDFRAWRVKYPDLSSHKITSILMYPVYIIVEQLRRKYRFEIEERGHIEILESNLREIDRNMAAFFEMWPEECPEHYTAAFFTKADQYYLLR